MHNYITSVYARVLAAIGMYFAPVLVFAQTATRDQSTVQTILVQVQSILNIIIPIVITIAVIYFMWGLVEYISSAKDSSNRAEGREIMTWGLVALFVLVSVYSLVLLVGRSFGVTAGGGVFQGPAVQSPGVQAAPGQGAGGTGGNIGNILEQIGGIFR
ncbi:MAG: hypothetical protein HYS59_01945 [Candidatus Vogelbacteria bacterium]|nr:hypothetical protein [Candidatus Vogelbacteria bacterium]